MVCKYCGGEVDDPFWDDTCRECEHEMNHSGFCDPNCQECLWDAEDRYEQGMEPIAGHRDCVYEG